MRSFAAFAVLGLSLLAGPARAEIDYTLRAEPAAQVFDVGIDLEATGPTTEFRIPAWCPGYYQLAAYQDKISDVAATGPHGASLPVIRAAPREWTVAAQTGARLHLSYRVRADDPGLGFFGAMLGPKVGFVNGASTFMYVDGRETEPDRLALSLPSGWDVASSMDRDAAGYCAKSGYDEFIDEPLQLGSFVRKKFTVEGIPFEAIYVLQDGTIRADLDAETERLRRVSAPAIKMFGGAAFKRYTYIVHLAVGNFDGGLEHRASTCIAVPNSPTLHLDDLAAHENFHAWNVKQIRPEVLGPFDYAQPCRTANLWWMEGVTDYYSKLMTYRSGLEDSNWLFGQIQEQFFELQNSGGRLSMTLADCSRKTWEADGFGVGDLSYYTKGFLAGLIFDASIRAQTNGKKSLDDVMRYLFAKYRLPHAGVPEDGLLAAMNAVVGKPGAMDPLYRSMIESTDELPYVILRNLGISATPANGARVAPGFELSGSDLVSVSREAAVAGLEPGDRVVLVDDSPWTGVGDPPQGYWVEGERDRKALRVEVNYSYLPVSRADFQLDAGAGAKALRLRAQWLERGSAGEKQTDQRPVGHE